MRLVSEIFPFQGDSQAAAAVRRPIKISVAKNKANYFAIAARYWANCRARF
jgi:hypothetical protein